MKKLKKFGYDITGYKVKDDDIIIYYSDGNSITIDYTKKDEEYLLKRIKDYKKKYMQEIKSLKIIIEFNKQIIQKETVYLSRGSFYKDKSKVEKAKEDIKTAEEYISRLKKALFFIENERLINNEMLRQYDYLPDEEKENYEASVISIDDLDNYTSDDLKEIVELIKNARHQTLKKSIK